MPRKVVRKAPKTALQLDITLRDTKPRIWRRILVADNVTFWDLHIAIQDAMGWTNSHLHEFQIGDPDDPERIGTPDGDAFSPVCAGWEVPVRSAFEDSPYVDYTYDFGDGWRHALKLEARPALDGGRYPRCLAGSRRCPPEDCGGPYGYADLLAVLADPNDERHAELSEWANAPFDPAEFDPEAVVFSDPEQELKWAMDRLL